MKALFSIIFLISVSTMYVSFSFAQTNEDSNNHDLQVFNIEVDNLSIDEEAKYLAQRRLLGSHPRNPALLQFQRP